MHLKAIDLNQIKKPTLTTRSIVWAFLTVNEWLNYLSDRGHCDIIGSQEILKFFRIDSFFIYQHVGKFI